jgi:hypothetical protein
MENLPTILKNITQAKRIAIALPQQLTLDAVCAALALQITITSQPDKTVTLFSASTDVPALPFLGPEAQHPQLNSALSNSNGLAIKIANSHAQSKELRYEKTSEGGLVIFVTPAGAGQFLESDVSVLPNAASFDLVIILGAANFEQLGSVYTDNTKLFFETPNINIDIDPSNEYYGTVNAVNTTATSLCEVVMDIIEAIPNALSNETVSTSLLAGIISQTASFRDPKTTPATLLKASRLVASGAKRQNIIQHLFKTKPLPLLQLWGRALARLTVMPEKQALTAVITATDLEKTKVETESLPIVLRDIVEMVTGYSLVILLAELPAAVSNGANNSANKVQALLAGLPHENILQLASKLIAADNPSADNSNLKISLLVGKHEYVSFPLSKPLAEIQQMLNEQIEKRSLAS